MTDTALDALALLRADHNELFTLMGRLQDIVDQRHFSDVGVVRDQLLMLYSAHEAIEQQLFWPAVRLAVDDGAALADHAIDEEETAKQLLRRLRDDQSTQPAYGDTVSDFVGLVRGHLVFEEAAVWPRFNSDISAPHRATLSRYISRIRPSAPSTPHPRAPSGSTDKRLVRDLLTGRDPDTPPPNPLRRP